MSRNLLPGLRRAPNPANVSAIQPGKWGVIQAPHELAKLDYGKDDGAALRTRLQSVPSPWARMLLFRNALEDSTHPGRFMVANEILDGLEFLWSQSQFSRGRVEYPRVGVDDLVNSARSIGNQRVQNFGDALAELRPRSRSQSGKPAFERLTIVTVEGRPVLGSSPYTLLFTAEDARLHTSGHFFQFSVNGRSRSLADRSKAFQQYVAQVILPQLEKTSSPDLEQADWDRMRGVVRQWLKDEAERCRPEDIGVSLNELGNVAWERRAEILRLTRLDVGLPGVVVFQRERGDDDSRWRVRTTRQGARKAPLLLERNRFDGVYFSGSPEISLPADFTELSRDVLPVSGVRYPWVNGTEDWFTKRLVTFEQALDPDTVMFGAGADGDGDEPRDHKFAIPLTSRFFELFHHSDVERMLTMRVDRGQVVCTLKLTIGTDDDSREIEIRKTYDESQISAMHAPALAIWPRFRDDRWKSYVVFRHDGSRPASDLYRIAAIGRDGTILQPGTTEQRSLVVSTYGFSECPEIVVIQDGHHEAGEDLGVVIPRFKARSAQTEQALHVGVDFGTSNTVVSVRDDESGTTTLLEADKVILALTKVSVETQRLISAYFFPVALEARPFGTALIYAKTIRSHLLDEQMPGVQVNVPFGGHLEDDTLNSVAGDLKWSTESLTNFLTESFLKHVMSMIVTYAIQRGNDPSRIRLSYAYPRAFTEMQKQQLDGFWKKIWRSFEAQGIAFQQLPVSLDESQAILHHFYAAGSARVAADTTVVLDIGGGTCDLAVYQEGKTRALDSLMLGGRNLTGARARAASPEAARNKFVSALVTWAENNRISEYPVEHRAIKTYIRENQDHLAFSYAMGTRWYRDKQAQFSRCDEAQRFQVVVLYLFGALFYYTGLSLREIAARTGEIPSLRHMILAGNGSRYLSWLTGTEWLSESSSIHRFLVEMVRAGARAGDFSGLKIESSGAPKEEVARGLIVKHPPPLDTSDMSDSTLVGESVQWSDEILFSSIDRFGDARVLQPNDVVSLKWKAERLEIQDFHDALLRHARVLEAADTHWASTTAEIRGIFVKLTRGEIESLTKGYLHQLANAGHGFQGSLFAAEVAAILEHLTDAVFAWPVLATSAPAHASSVAR